MQIEASLLLAQWLARRIEHVKTSLGRGLGPPGKAPKFRFDGCKPDAEKGRQREEQDEEGPLSTQTQEGPVGALQLCEHTGPVSLFAL